MKSTLFLAAATLAITAANAQDTTTNGTMGTTGTTGSATVTDTTKKLNAYGSYSTRDSTAAKYKLLPMPGPLTLEKTFPVLGTYQLSAPDAATGSSASGSYGTTSTTGTATGTTTNTTTTTTGTTTDASGMATTGVASAPALTITLDSASKGIVWVEGLPQGKMRAFLKKSPATYRIIAQKTESGTSIPEGTLHLDQHTNTLHVVLGAPYNEADPTGVFALGAGTTPEDNTAEVKVKTKNTKMKQKLHFYTASKVVTDGQQMQQGVNGFDSSLQQAQQNSTGNQ